MQAIFLKSGGGGINEYYIVLQLIFLVSYSYVVNEAWFKFKFLNYIYIKNNKYSIISEICDTCNTQIWLQHQ